MGVTKYVRSAWKSPKQSMEPRHRTGRMAVWRHEPVFQRIDKPTRIDAARRVGYRAKQGVVICRTRVRRGGLRKGVVNMKRKPSKSGVTKITMAKSIQRIADAFRDRLGNVQFNNTTELNSTIYFCRANHNDFNYSSNPTYLTGSKLRVKTMAADAPVSYITTVGLYSADNELLAVAKLSEPLRKSSDTELTLRVRLDY